jgi:formylglycine-generating enzyme required for sulfatase activity
MKLVGGMEELVEFVMGDDQWGRYRIQVQPFYIDRFEVTNSQYQNFIQSTGHTPPVGWSPDGRDFPGQAYDPVVNVSWHDATAYCQHYGKRLPSEAEWELACRSRDERDYPWGNEWDAFNANTEELDCPGPLTVGSFSPAGDSVYGVADMSGNVFEWVSTVFSRYPYNNDDGREDLSLTNADRVLRGGAWNGDQSSAGCSYRMIADPYAQVEYVGFRCAKNPNGLQP